MIDITLYTHPHSRGVTVSWMLEECDAQYKAVPLQFRTQMKTPEYLAINPAGKVPALKVGDMVVTETAAIVMYLADVFVNKKLAPAVDEPKRGEYYKWMFVLCNQFEPALTDIMFNIHVTEDMRFALGYPELDVIVKQVTQQLEQHDYLLGDSFSVADMMLAALLAWASEHIKIMTLNETLAAYLKKVTSRPAFIRSQELNAGYLSQLPA